MLFLTILVSLALLAGATLKVLERVQAEPSGESVIAQQEGVRVVAEIRGSPNLGDSDGDGVPDVIDNCPAWPNSLQSLPPWPIATDDPDCDGWSTSDENAIGTNPTLACGTNAWPPDFNDDQVVNILDVLFLAPPVFFSVGPDPPYQARVDLNPDGVINVLDVNRMAPPIFFAICTP